MITIIKGFDRDRHPELFDRLFKLRYEVFVRQRGWSLPTVGDLEIDQYDTPEATYFIDMDERGIIHASTRVTPTAQSSLTADYFPHLVEDGVDPRGDHIYEATRYMVLGDGRSARSARAAKIRVLEAIFKWCIERQAEYIQTVVDKEQLPTFVSISLATRPLGLAHPFGGGKGVPGGGECMALRWPATQVVLDDIIQYGLDHQLFDETPAVSFS